MKLMTVSPNMMVKDVDATIKYYEEILGFKTIMRMPEIGAGEWAMLKKDEVCFMVQSEESLAGEYPLLRGTATPPPLALYCMLEGVQEYYDTIKDKVEIVKEIKQMCYGMREFAIKDINGFLIVFGQEVR